MLKLGGWDTVTLSDIGLVNTAMKRRQNQLISEFDYKERSVHVSGRFGAWQIGQGGGGRTVFVTIPIQSGKLKFGREGTVDLSGLSVKVKLKLMLLPPPDGGDHSELRFDLSPDPDAGPDDPVLPIDVIDPHDQLDEMNRQMLILATAACLSAHADDVTFVIASVKARGTSDAEQLSTPYRDWGHVVTADGRQYLSLFGSLNEPKKRPDTIDPSLIATAGSAYLAFSHRMFAQRFLLPEVIKSFKQRAFRASGNWVVNTKPIRLPKSKKNGVTVDPMIQGIKLGISGKALVCDVAAEIELPGRLTFHCKMQMYMPFKFNAKTGELRFEPDNNPKLDYTVSLPWPLDALIGWLVRIIVRFFDKPIRNMITSIAQSTQHVASPKVSSANWTGIRDFKTGSARVDGAIWLADTRSA